MQPELKMRVFTVVRRYRCANLLPLTVLKSAAPPPASIAPSSVPPFFWSSICYTVLDRSPWCPVPPLIATILFLFSSLSGIQLGYAQLTIQSFTRFKDVAPFIWPVDPATLIISSPMDFSTIEYPLASSYTQNPDTRISLLQ